MTRLWPFYSDDAIVRVQERVRSGDLSALDYDPDIARCEELFQQRLTNGAMVLMCGSGTAALASAYAALGLEPGAEVLVPTHTFRATVTTLLQSGLVPVLCDSDPETGNIDLDDAAHRIGPQTAALVVTHVWGRPVPIRQARALADRHGLALVEDCSHAHGVSSDGVPVGSAADVAVFSLGTTKMVSGGTAGALVTRTQSLYERVLVHGQPKHRVLRESRNDRLRQLSETGVGHNLRASPLAAVLAADHLVRLTEFAAIKNRNLDEFTKILTEGSELRPLPRADSGTLYKAHARWGGEPQSYRSAIDLLKSHGVRAGVPAKPLHATPLFRDPTLLTAASSSLRAFAPATPGDYPATDRFLTDLIEFDTRDLYDSATADQSCTALRAAVHALGGLRPGIQAATA